MKTGLAAFAAIALATSASAATAAENPFVKEQVALNLGDLDLATAKGQQSLAIRMDQAARAVCGENMANVHLLMESRTRECRAAVIADVRARIEARLASASQPVRFASAD